MVAADSNATNKADERALLPLPLPPPQQQKTLLLASPQNQNDLQTARRILYVSHIFAQFSEQAWQFALILFLAAFGHYQSMVLVSTYGLTVGFCVCLFGARAGQLVDTSDRLWAAHFFMAVENASVLLATTLCYFLLQWQPPSATTATTTTSLDLSTLDNGSNSSGSQATGANNPTDNDLPPVQLQQSFFYGVSLDTISILLLIGIHIFGPLAQIMDRGFLVAIERDWVVVMSSQVKTIVTHTSTATLSRTEGEHTSSDETDESTMTSTAETTHPKSNASEGDDNNDTDDEIRQKQWLSETNVTMRQMDLSAKIIAPAIAGFVIGAFDRQIAASSSSSTESAATNYNISNNENNTGTNELPGQGHDLTGAALLVGLVNLAALIIQWICTARIYQLVPALAIKLDPQLCEEEDSSKESEEKGKEGQTPTSACSELEKRKEVELASQGEVMSNDYGMTSCLCFSKLPLGLRVYLRQPISMAGLGLALL